VWEAGGFPLEFPVMSLGETMLRPTAMLFRNLASMDVEESIRGNPIDGVVLLMGCDKTTPALMMGAASCDLPTIGVSGGPMLSGKFRGQDLGSGTDVWKMSEEVRAGHMSQEDFFEAEGCMHRSHGHCMTMGTASTMACMVESLGVSCPATRPFPPWTRAATSWRTRRAGASCRWSRKPGAVEDPDAPGLRERHQGQRRHRRVHQCGDPPAGHRRAHRRGR
jgi:dihydroxy-acid dehydratase